MSDKHPQMIAFQIEVRRVLGILSNDIYDSPYALLRENIQNAYDAVLMRQEIEGGSAFQPEISVELADNKVIITDNGIGMDEAVVSNNFWTAGSSGKNNELARKAGVVGTFGIGAMANFGVCKSLRVVTHYYEGEQTIETYAKRETLSVTKKCIEIGYTDEERHPGTIVTAELDEEHTLNVGDSLNYLTPYVQYLPIPVKVNGTLISQNDYSELFGPADESPAQTCEHRIDRGDFQFTLKMAMDRNGIRVHCSDISQGGEPIRGDIVLVQDQGSIFGLRNFFGLAPVPVPSIFNFGGVVNLSVLQPTAGREALSRDCIEVVARIVDIIEQDVAEELSQLELANSNGAFHNYIVTKNRYDLSDNIAIELKPGEGTIPLREAAPEMNGKKVYYYGGRDQSTILDFGTENSYLLHLSRDNPRRRIQNYVLQQKRIEEVPDSPRILGVVDRLDLSMAEVSLLLRIVNVLSEDYLITDPKGYIAVISHELPSMVKYNNEIVEVYLSRKSGAVQQVLQTYETAYEVFGGFVKDFIRNHLYQKFASYIPSSTKEGADALHKILMRSWEMYKYDYSEIGRLELLMGQYVAGEIEFPEVLRRSTTIQKTHLQSVQQNQVGSVEQEIPSIVEEVPTVEQQDVNLLAPLPPIMKTETQTGMKILKTDKPYAQLNDITMFLSLSDRTFKLQLDFFLQPHTTKVIWCMHKIVYIFTHASGTLSFYYDIELKERLSDNTTGGTSIPNTTIITADKIFIPIIPELVPFFDIKEGGEKSFHVRYDIIAEIGKLSETT